MSEGIKRDPIGGYVIPKGLLSAIRRFQDWQRENGYFISTVVEVITRLKLTKKGGDTHVRSKNSVGLRNNCTSSR